jgi:hypothetical protein
VSALVPVFPAASRAVTVRTFAPDCRGIPLAVQVVVPLAVPPPPRSFAQVTAVTPTLSAAVPPRVRGVLLVAYVAAAVGAVMLSVGGVVSAGATGVALAVAPVEGFPAASEAQTR